LDGRWAVGARGWLLAEAASYKTTIVVSYKRTAAVSGTTRVVWKVGALRAAQKTTTGVVHIGVEKECTSEKVVFVGA
jgi:hypothetical protein